MSALKGPREEWRRILHEGTPQWVRPEGERLRLGDGRTPALVTPTYFQKPLTTLNAHRGFLNRPANCKYLNYEGEIAAIVGKPMRDVAREDVWPASRRPTMSARRISATPTPARCCGSRARTASARSGRASSAASTSASRGSGPKSTARWSRTARSAR